MASSAVADLLKVFGSDPALFAESPSIYGLPTKLSPSASFTHPVVAALSDPYILFSNFEYKAGTTRQAIQGWDDIVRDAERNEKGTVSFTSIEDAVKGWVRTVEAYEDMDMLGPILEKRKATLEKRKGNDDLSSGKKEVWKLKMVAGYLYKEDTVGSRA